MELEHLQSNLPIWKVEHWTNWLLDFQSSKHHNIEMELELKASIAINKNIVCWTMINLKYTYVDWIQLDWQLLQAMITITTKQQTSKMSHSNALKSFFFCSHPSPMALKRPNWANLLDKVMLENLRQDSWPNRVKQLDDWQILEQTFQLELIKYWC